jgi:hypothetical protein
MALIKLGIHRDYCPKWGLWEGVREFVQNALDEDDKGNRLDFRFTGSELVLVNQGSEIPMSAMAVGYSSKRDDEQARGQYGEGMKLAMLALLRAGYPVKVATGDRTYKPEIVMDDKLACEVLAIRVGKRVHSPDTKIVIFGMIAAEYEEMRGRFVRMNRDLGEVIETPYGSILTSEHMRGKVYVKGIYVCDVENIEFGYDLHRCELDRDRSLPRQFDVEYYSSQCVKHAVEVGALSGKTVIEMATAGKTDSRHLFSSYGESHEYTEQVVAAFKERYPATAYVDHSEEIDPLLPFTVERIPAALRGIRHALPTVEEVLRESADSVLSVFDLNALSPAMRAGLSEFNSMFGGIIQAEFVVTGGRTLPILEGSTLRVPHRRIECAKGVFTALCEMSVSALGPQRADDVARLVARLAERALETWKPGLGTRDALDPLFE